MQLYALIGHPVLDLTAEEFGLCRILCGQLACVVFHDAAINEHLRDVDLGPHVGHLEACMLKLCDCFSKRPAFVNILHRRIESRLRIGNVSNRSKQPFLNQKVH